MTEARRLQINAASRRYYVRTVRARAAAGLTTRGTWRRYNLWPAALMRADRQRIERRDRVLAGFTTRGTRRVRRVWGKLDRNARMRLRTLANNALGLNARGTPLKRSQPLASNS